VRALPRVVALVFHLGYLLLSAAWVNSWRDAAAAAGLLALLWTGALFYLTVDRNRRP
jgi:hypothetical protein